MECPKIKVKELLEQIHSKENQIRKLQNEIYELTQSISKLCFESGNDI